MENAYLKKLNALVQNKEKSPKKDKAQVIYEPRKAFLVKAIKVSGTPTNYVLLLDTEF